MTPISKSDITLTVLIPFMSGTILLTSQAKGSGASDIFSPITYPHQHQHQSQIDLDSPHFLIRPLNLLRRQPISCQPHDPPTPPSSLLERLRPSPANIPSADQLMFPLWMIVECIAKQDCPTHLQLEARVRQVVVHELDGSKECVGHVGEGTDMIFDFELDFE